jgi:tight adherence protein C
MFGTASRKTEEKVAEPALVGASGGYAAAGGSAPSRAAVNEDPEEISPLLERLGSLAVKLSPNDYARRLQRRLDLAGNPAGWPAQRVLAMKGVGLIFGVLIGTFIGLKHGIGVVLFPIGLGALFFFLPDIWIRNLGEHRQEHILNGLPDALDMLTVCVEAGLGFDAAMARVAQNLEGPMASECARVIQEMQFGKSRTDALRALVDRTDVSELRAFVSALIQSADLGISVGVVLREQAKEMRIRRRQRAEEKAQKLPVKILLPLVFCLLPAMFVVILGPAVINIFHNIGHLNK